MKAFILCAGKASRLRPLTCGFPKAVLPFLNLPLLYYNWFYLEHIGLSHAVLNSHLFPEMLREAAEGAKTPKQKTDISFEPESLGGAGGLFSVRSFFEKESRFIYLNGDSLFFPSRKEQLGAFLAQGAKQNPPALFWAVPFPPGQKVCRALWMDQSGALRAVGGPLKAREAGFKPAPSGKNLKPEDLKPGELRPVQFSGTALLTKEIFHILSDGNHSVFHPSLRPPLSEGLFKVFVDEGGLVFEGGEKGGLLKACHICLQALFSDPSSETSETKPSSSTQNSFVRDLLLEIFRRFDPADKKTGLKRGKALTRKKGAPILCPESVKGADLLQVRGFAVLGPNVSFTEKSFLNSAVIGEGVSWSGPLNKQILMKFPPPF